MTLLLRTGVVGEMLPYEPHRGDGGDKSHDTADEPADVVSFEVDIAVFEEGFRIGGLVWDDGACEVDHGRRWGRAERLLARMAAEASVVVLRGLEGV